MKRGKYSWSIDERRGELVIVCSKDSTAFDKMRIKAAAKGEAKRSIKARGVNKGARIKRVRWVMR